MIYKKGQRGTDLQQVLEGGSRSSLTNSFFETEVKKKDLI